MRYLPSSTEGILQRLLPQVPYPTTDTKTLISDISVSLNQWINVDGGGYTGQVSSRSVVSFSREGLFSGSKTWVDLGYAESNARNTFWDCGFAIFYILVLL